MTQFMLWLKQQFAKCNFINVVLVILYQKVKFCTPNELRKRLLEKMSSTWM